MQSKENKQLMKSLKGEYKKFAKRICLAVRFRCSGNAVEETLGDMLALLAEAQETGQPLCDVIPDKRATIRETVACLPRKKLQRAAVCLLAAAAVICACTGGAYAIWFSPVQLSAVQFIYYDGAQNVLLWDAVEHSDGYEVYVNDELTCETDCTVITLPDTLFSENGSVNFGIIAKGSGRYRDSEYVHNTAQLTLTEIKGNIAQLFTRDKPYGETEGYLKAETAACGPVRICLVTVVPEYHFFGEVYAEGVLLATENGRETDASQPLTFRAGSSYSFYVDTRQTDALRIRVASFTECDNAELLPGITLFDLDGGFGTSVYGATDKGLSFACASVQERREIVTEGYYGSSVYPCYHDGRSELSLILANNHYDGSAALELQECIIQLQSAEQTGEFYFAAGYTAVRTGSPLPPQEDEPSEDIGIASGARSADGSGEDQGEIDPFYRKKGLALYIYGDSAYITPEVKTVCRLSFRMSFTLFQAPWDDDCAPTYLFYAEAPTRVRWEHFDHFDEANTVQIDENTTEITFKPGLNVLKLPEGDTDGGYAYWSLQAKGYFGLFDYVAAFASPRYFSEQNLTLKQTLLRSPYPDRADPGWVDDVYPELSEELKEIIRNYFQTMTYSQGYFFFNPSGYELSVSVEKINA